MNVEELRNYCLNMKGTTERFPIDEYTLVQKVQGKKFTLIPLDNNETQITLKCDPDPAIVLREEYSAIFPARHFNKKDWNIVKMDPSVLKKSCVN